MCVCVCALQECFPLWSQFACHLWSVCISTATLHLPVPCRSPPLLSHAVYLPRKHSNDRQSRSIFAPITNVTAERRKEKRVIKEASLEQRFPPRGACSQHPPRSFTAVCELCQISGSSSGRVVLLIWRLCCIFTDLVIQKVLTAARNPKVIYHLIFPPQFVCVSIYTVEL